MIDYSDLCVMNADWLKKKIEQNYIDRIKDQIETINKALESVANTRCEKDYKVEVKYISKVLPEVREAFKEVGFTIYTDSSREDVIILMPTDGGDLE